LRAAPPAAPPPRAAGYGSGGSRARIRGSVRYRAPGQTTGRRYRATGGILGAGAWRSARVDQKYDRNAAAKPADKGDRLPAGGRWLRTEGGAPSPQRPA